MKKIPFIKAASLLLCSGMQQLSAQSILDGKNKPELSVMLSEVVVTGTGTEHLRQDAPVQTEIITKRSIERYQARSLDELLGGLMASFSFHGGSMGSNVSLNGLNNSYILIMIDGRRMNGDIGGQNDLNFINLEDIERIEMVKGAVSSLYGSDAIAGVINIITKKAQSNFSLSSTSRIGAYGELQESLSVNLGSSKIKSLISFQIKHTDGWQNTDLQWSQQQLKSGSTLKTVNKSTHYSLSEKLEWEPTPYLNLKLGGSYYERWVDRSQGAWSYLPNDFYYKNYGIYASAKYKLGKKDYLLLDSSYDRYGYFYDYKLQEVTDYFIEGNRITHYPGQRILQSLQNQVLLSLKSIFYLNKHTLNAGLEYKLQRLNSPHHIERDRASVYTLAAYLQDEWTIIPKMVLTMGLRSTLHQETGFNLSPKVALLYKALEGLRLRATYASAYKSPSIKELYYNYVGSLGGGSLTAYHGNRSLKAQTSQYLSLGTELQTEQLQLELSGYLNYLDNMIELIEIKPSIEEKLNEIRRSKKYVNLTKAHIWGIESSINYKPTEVLSFRLSYSFTDPKAQYPNQGERYMKYIPIDGTFKHSLALNASWQHSWQYYKLGVSLFGNYQSTRHYLENNDAAAYQIWRLNTSHTLLGLKRWSIILNLGLDNIFGYVDRTPFGRNRATSSPGRTLYLSLQLKFR